MMHIYTKKSSSFKMQPKEKTIQFLLNFSSSLRVKEINKNVFVELNLN